MKTIVLKNGLLEAVVAAHAQGRVIRLSEVESGRLLLGSTVPDADVVAEGGHVPFFGLETWLKTGDIADPNTGVLSAFAPLQRVPRAVSHSVGSAVAESAEAGLSLRQEWGLAPGREPLVCRASLTNSSAPAADFQFEFFFVWTIPGERWARTAVALPGLPARSLRPYGEIVFEGSPDADGPACFWDRDTRQGVALRGLGGIERWFYGIQNGTLVVGPHSARRRLAAGEILECAFSIEPVSGGTAAADVERRESELVERERRASSIAVSVGGLAEWAKPPRAADALPVRAVHLTMQYAPAGLEEVKRLLAEVVAPLGFNQLMLEIGRAFPYRTHPKLGAGWAYPLDAWRDLAGAARGLGLEVVPQYNALGHQGESGLATIYPELREDDAGWCLNPEHPKTLPYLRDVIGELLDAFEAASFHIGLDEIDVPSRPQTFALPKAGRARDGGGLFAMHVVGLAEFLKARKVGCMMWADMLFHRPEHNTVNGLRSGSWRAIDRIPRDVLMIDWVYAPVRGYGGSDYLRSAGFKVMGATWNAAAPVRDFARHAARTGMIGMCATTWSAPDVRGVPLACLVVAGKYFRNPDAEPFERVVEEAEALAVQVATGGGRH